MEPGSRWSRLAPPAGLVPRIRWAFLTANLLVVASFVVRTTLVSSQPAPVRALCVVTLALLAAWWVRGLPASPCSCAACTTGGARRWSSASPRRPPPWWPRRRCRPPAGSTSPPCRRRPPPASRCSWWSCAWSPWPASRPTVAPHAGDEVLRVTGPRPPSQEVGDALLVVATQLSCALTNAALHADLAHRADHDPVTGLVNRRRLDEVLAAAVAGERSRDALALLTLDLDGFKAVNDAHGHAVGDDLQVAVARRLLDQVGGEDLVGRTGGDEFVVLVVGGAAAARARDLGGRLLEAVGAPFAVDGHELRVGVSIGTAVHAGGSAQGLLRLSDRAMHRAKDAGRHRVVHLDALREPAAAPV